MENIIKIIKVLKVLESALSVENNLGPEFKNVVETDHDVLQDVYNLVEDLDLLKFEHVFLSNSPNLGKSI